MRREDAARIAEEANAAEPPRKTNRGTLEELEAVFYGREHGLDPRLTSDEWFPDWPKIEGRACALFGHATFTSATFERLHAFLAAEHGLTLEQALALPTGDVLRLLNGGKLSKTAVVLNSNDPRDKWLYRECCDGTRFNRIISKLATKSQWEPIANISGIKRAANSYASRHGLPEIPKRQQGRPTK